ncbi:MAG TPA: class I SAM-dependent methyltransferase [Gammaproteobacteria bacterium]|nr:class I SAM-dependent methyltransferase [Gammaproteobacteria bacterium]
MVKTYRTTQHWDHWLTQFLGKSLLEAEQRFLQSLLADQYGKHALLIGVPRQYGLLQSSVISHHIVLSPLLNRHIPVQCIESEFDELPVAAASVDLVLLPHTLEYINNPHHLLAEACRVVKPEGHIIIVGFNPWSLWGLKRYLTKNKSTVWPERFISANTVQKWLELADFKLVKKNKMLFRPPLHHHRLYKKLEFLEWLGQKCFLPFGGVYILTAKAKVIPLTPIKLRWKQPLPALRVTIPGSTMRRSS